MPMFEEYRKTYSSYSGCDMVASIIIPDYCDAKPIVIGSLQTISYSIHREVNPVRALGRINPLGFTNGPRTIAGSLIFTVFDKNLVRQIISKIKSKDKESIDKIKTESIVMDEMPLFDVLIVMKNDYGQKSRLIIKGIVIVDEGQVMSIEDMITENTMSFMAEDIEVLKKLK